MSRDVRIRQIVAGQKVRVILLGKKTTDANEALVWSKIPAYFCSKGFMRYSHMLDEANRFAAANGCPLTEDRADSIRIAFVEHLTHEAKTNPKYLDNKRQYKRFLDQGRRKAVARDALLQQLCPYCGMALPCYQHDIGKVSLDGRGGLVHSGYEGPQDSDAASPGG